jgi:hypothetical protein
MMGRHFAKAAMAIGLATAGLSTGTRAQDIAMPCDAFIRNADGSWATMRDVPISGMGRKLVLRQGSELRPGAAILSVDFATLLEQQCPSVSVAVPDPAPLPAPGSAPASEPKVEMSRYADAKGNIDFQKLTCGQLANTSPQDADFLGALYIGWYNGLAKKNAINVMRIKDVIRDLVVHCRANKGQRVTQAIDFIRNRPPR